MTQFNIWSIILVHTVRMTRSQFPIQDIFIICGQHILDVSLWRDEAVAELHEGYKVKLTHLLSTIQLNGKGKLTFEIETEMTLK